MVIGDERAIYWWCCPNASTAVTSQGVLRGFGDMIPRRSSDAYASFNQGAWTSQVTTSGDPVDLFNSASTVNSIALYFARNQSGLGSSVSAYQFSESRRAVTSDGGKSGNQLANTSPFPNAADNGLDLERLLFMDPGNSVRGYAPGLWHMAQNVGFAFATLDRIQGQGVLAGRKLLVLRGGAPGSTAQNSTSYAACACIDITGPWR